MAEHPTIDMTVALDYLDPRQKRNALAVALIDLARRGEVEFAAAPQGYRLDLQGSRAGTAEQLRAAFSRERVEEMPQLSYPSAVTYPGSGLFPGNYVPGLAEATKGSSPGEADRFHIETHIAEGRNVFITDDARLLRLCDRLSEQGFPIKAMTLGDYLARRRG